MSNVHDLTTDYLYIAVAVVWTDTVAMQTLTSTKSNQIFNQKTKQYEKEENGFRFLQAVQQNRNLASMLWV